MAGINPFRSAFTPSTDGRSTRSKGPPPARATDWSTADAKVRKLAPGGRGGKGIESDWDLEDELVKVEAPFSPLASKMTKVKPKGPPPPDRSIVENTPTKDLIEENSVCRSCHSDLYFTLPTCCVTAIPQLECSNSKCSVGRVVSDTASTSVKSGSQKQMTDYALNILYVISFMASGDGGVEAQRLLGFLGIANLASMAKWSFSSIERRISSAIQSITEAALRMNLIEEVRLTMEDDVDFDFQEWKNAFINQSAG